MKKRIGIINIDIAKFYLLYLFMFLIFLKSSLNAEDLTGILWVAKEVIFTMKIIGTIYMLYLAYQILNASKSHNDTNYGNFTSGFVMQFLNPKVVLFCLTVLPSFVLKADSTFNDVFLNVTIITIIGFLAFASWLLFGTVLKKFIDQHLKVFNVIMSLALVMATLLIWVLASPETP